MVVELLCYVGLIAFPFTLGARLCYQQQHLFVLQCGTSLALDCSFFEYNFLSSLHHQMITIFAKLLHFCYGILNYAWKVGIWVFFTKKTGNRPWFIYGFPINMPGLNFSQACPQGTQTIEHTGMTGTFSCHVRLARMDFLPPLCKFYHVGLPLKEYILDKLCTQCNYVMHHLANNGFWMTKLGSLKSSLESRI